MSARPLFSILHPTARLPDGWIQSYMAWRNAARLVASEIEYLLCIDDSNEAGFVSGTHPMQNWQVTLVRNFGPQNSVAAYNAAAAASTGLILINNMDDLFPPKRWDELIWEAVAQFIPDDPVFEVPLYQLPPDLDRVLHCSSGSPRDDNLFIPQIMTRARYERLGYVFHPSYRTAYADDEFTQHAQQDGVVVEARHIIFRHLHPQLSDPERWPWDECYTRENRAEDYAWGRENFERRKETGWPK